MLNPQMESWSFYEATRRKAEQLRAEQRGKPEPPQTEWAIGSMEWLAEHEQIELNRCVSAMGTN